MFVWHKNLLINTSLTLVGLCSSVTLAQNHTVDRFGSLFTVLNTSKIDCSTCMLYQDATLNDSGQFGKNQRLTADEEKQFAAVNKIECKTASGATVKASAPLVKNSMTALTNAHLFYNEYSYNQEIEPNACVYAIYDTKGHVVERVPLITIHSRWQENKKYNDDNTDYAVVKLAHAPKTKIEPIKIEIGTKPDSFELVAFHSDVDDDATRVKSAGDFFDKTSTADEFKDHTLIHNATSAAGSSGGALVNPSTGALFAIQQGWSHQDGRVDPKIFNRKYNYNRALVIDQKIADEIDAN